MARLARVIATGYPHHVTQRGNRRQPVFFSDGDYAGYLDLLGEWCGRHEVEVWAYCLMPNHVHLMLVPQRSAGAKEQAARCDLQYSSSGWREHLDARASPRNPGGRTERGDLSYVSPDITGGRTEKRRNKYCVPRYQISQISRYHECRKGSYDVHSGAS